MNSLAGVCLVVPCYNEEKRLDVAAFRAFLSENSGIRLILVDDGSTDQTLRVFEEVKAGNEGAATILRCEANNGKAEAVRRGMLHALDNFDPRIVGFWDADLATPLGAVYELAHILDTRPDIEMVFGARVKLLGRHVERRLSRHYLGRVFATVVSNVLNMAIYDTQCGAKLFRVEPETRGIFAEPFLSKWIFDVEILARYSALLKGDSKKLQSRIYEYPLEKWVDIAGSKVHTSDFFKAFWEVLRIYWKYLA